MSTATRPPASPAPGLSSGWSLALGILLVIAGVVALLFPVMAAFAASLYIGWFALIAGAIAIAVAIKTRTEPEFGLIGYLVGFQIITCGVLRIGVALASSKAAPAAAA